MGSILAPRFANGRVPRERGGDVSSDRSGARLLITWQSSLERALSFSSLRRETCIMHALRERRRGRVCLRGVRRGPARSRRRPRVAMRMLSAL